MINWLISTDFKIGSPFINILYWILLSFPTAAASLIPAQKLHYKGLRAMA